MAIQAGSLRERITILRAVCETLPNGEVREWYAEVATVRAQVIQQRSAKALTYGENWYPTARSFRLRLHPQVLGGDRIRYHGQLYEALPPKVFQREGMQEVDCDLVQMQSSVHQSDALSASVEGKTLIVGDGD